MIDVPSFVPDSGVLGSATHFQVGFPHILYTSMASTLVEESEE